MKGIVFTEFIEMVEDNFSFEIAEQIIETSDLPSGGVYTALGTYDSGEMVQLIAQLSAVTGLAASELTHTFGKRIFGRFVTIYPQFFEGVDSAFDFLKSVDKYIHLEVLKLYPDAQLPSIEYDDSRSGRLILIYKSARPFADLAEGLITGCIEHFGEKIELQREDPFDRLRAGLAGEQGAPTRFILTSLRDTL